MRPEATATSFATSPEITLGAPAACSAVTQRPPVIGQRFVAAAGGRLVGSSGRGLVLRRAAEGSTDGAVVYAVGDVHGRLDLLEALVRQIDDHAAGDPNALILCGDYVDRGPDSAGVLEWLLALRRERGESLYLLKGNHEQALLRFIAEPGWGACWIDQFGGAATLSSYGVTPPGPCAGRVDLERARDLLLTQMPASHLHLLQRLDLMVVFGDHAFVHAGVSPDAPLREQTEDDLLWAREAFIASRRRFEKVIVHGHSWYDEKPALLRRRIGVDTGAYETGVLTAVRLEDGRREVLQACDEIAAARQTARRGALAPALVTAPPDYAHAPAAAIRARFSMPTVSLQAGC